MTDQLIEALSSSDELSRGERATRIRWLSQHIPSVSGFIAPIEATVLMDEARQCFVNGQFVAALMLAASFIEHKLSDALRLKELINDSPSFACAIELAQTNQVFPPDLLHRTDLIRQIRNPFAHRKPDNHEHSLGNRFLSLHVHPQTVIESDAALAIQAMYEYFSLTLVRA
ncbi:hypothetical protein [Rhodanobacter soli]|uniref:hypothetical protein n=1 Tax=Rhodanobacter soli TaxID=590609 RepID=UPI0031DA9BC8